MQAMRCIRNGVSTAALLSLSVAAYGCTNQSAGAPGPANGPDTAFTLTLDAPTAVQAIGPELAAARTSRFVEIEVSQVRNPALIPISFSVCFEPDEGEPVLLGVFGLFPPDNPGTFIVATAGEVRKGGSVRVTLVPATEVAAQSELNVRIGHIRLREE